MPHHARVTAYDGDNGVIIIALSADLARYIGDGVTGKLHVEYGSGPEHGKLRLRAASAADTAFVVTFPVGRQLRFNIRAASLSGVAHPIATTILPHELQADSLLIDLQPLSSKKS